MKEDNVCALAWGGASAGEINAVATEAEELKVLLCSHCLAGSRQAGEREIHSTCPHHQIAANYVNKANLIINKLKPKTLAFLYNDDADA